MTIRRLILALLLGAAFAATGCDEADPGYSPLDAAPKDSAGAASDAPHPANQSQPIMGTSGWRTVPVADLPAISGVAAYDDGLRSVARNTDILVIDAPARVHGTELNELVRRAETIIVPVLPSNIDMKACSHFMAELLEIGKVSRKQARLAVIANRVREYTLIYEELDQYLTKLKVPYLGSLREAQNYVRAYARGMGVLELPEYLGWPDWKQWEPIGEWLDSKRSQPAA